MRERSGAVAIDGPAGQSGTPPGLGSLPPGLPKPLSPQASGGHLVGGGAGPLDEEQERWLIQKEDKMDYGPFSLRDVRAQIEKGTVHAEHNILDNETGDRRRVADHPLIGAMSRDWAAKHAELERQLRDQKERARHRDSVVKLLSLIFVALVIIGAGVAAYLKLRKEPVKVIVKKGNEFTDDPLKGLSISMKVDPPAAKKHGGKKRTGPKNGAFDDSQSLDMSGEGDDTLSSDDIQKVMTRDFGKLSGCLREEASRNPGVKRIDLDFLVKGNGSVSSVRVNGQTSSAVASCVFAKMQSISFPECKTCSKTHATFSLSLK